QLAAAFGEPPTDCRPAQLGHSSPGSSFPTRLEHLPSTPRTAHFTPAPANRTRRVTPKRAWESLGRLTVATRGHNFRQRSDPSPQLLPVPDRTALTPDVHSSAARFNPLWLTRQTRAFSTFRQRAA